jgi:polyhydroxyalkanoate synthase subunit PhaC
MTTPQEGKTAMTSNPNEASRNVEDVAAQAAEEVLGPNPFIGLRPADIFAALSEVGEQALKAPLATWQQEAGLARALFSVLTGTADIAPAKGDKRFADPAWNDNPFYRRYLQGYLTWTNALDTFVESTGLDSVSRQRAKFVMSLLADSVAPTNTLLGNPAALKKAIDSGGKSLLEGSKNLIADVTRNGGMPAQVDMTAFEPGRNLALSPGSVVWRNEVLELIQYAPATGEVHARPQLIVPPQINKFYIFDMAPGRSIVEYLVKGGLQVFIVSWRNPTPEQRAWDMDTYVSALLEAIDVMRDITGSDDVNIHGACSGAMTVAALLGHLAAKKQKRINAATLMVAVLDTDTDSLLGLFATPESIAAAKLNSKMKGVLDGDEMGRVFSWMRPNDLIWNYWVNNYLMGNPPPVFDILYWNNDTTRLPAAFHAQILDIFGAKMLQEPGTVSILGTPIDLSQVDCDKFVVAGVTDHITPWKGVYRTASLFGGNTEFILSSSGHIQSLINPPGNPKSKYFLGRHLPGTSENWLATAKPVQGTWWDHWRQWIATRSGETRPAPTELGNERHRPGVKAPGTYVLEP